MKRKYLITGLVIGLQLVSGYSYESDASWLSKTWDRLETNAAKQSMIGQKPNNIDIIVLVSM